MDNMRLERPIVVGVEDKQSAALRYALVEAHAQGCGVRVVHAYSLGLAGSDLFDSGAVDTSAEDADAVIATAREFIETQDIKVPVEYVVERGLPTQILAAESIQARALILGPENSTWYERILASEIGCWLSEHATCPVVVVPEGWFPQTPRRGGIVVTVNCTSSARGPLTYAFAAADRSHQELHAMHVVAPSMSQADEEKHRVNLEEVMAGWADDYPEVKVFQSLVFADVDEACLGVTTVANLVVVGRPQGFRLPFAVARPVAATVIKEAKCPVAVIPTDYAG